MLSGPFTFDTSRHAYRVGATAVPGIHAVLRAGGVEPRGGPWFTAEHRARGKAVHYATLAYDLGTDAPTLPDEWRGYFDAYLAFREAVPCRWRLMEHPLVHRALRYASIIDRAGPVSEREAVFEIKTGSPAPFHGPQLAGADLLISPKIRVGGRRRLAVYLHADGTFKLREYDAARDYADFLDALARYWALEGHADGSTGDWV